MSDSRPESSNKRQKVGHWKKNAIEESNLQPNIAYEDSGIKLTTVEALSASENIDCVSLSSILSSEDLIEMVQFNYMVELEFLMSNLPKSKQKTIPTTIIHGLSEESEKNLKAEANLFKNVKLISPRLPIPYGTHHTKAMLLFYANSTMRLIIHTANAIRRDWADKTQGVYMSPFLFKKRDIASSSEFEVDFMDYLESYGDKLNIIRNKVKEYDFSTIKAILIASIPGYHINEKLELFGHMRLRNVLSRATIPLSCKLDSTIICQFSSIGSLGKDEKWLIEEFAESLKHAKNQSQCSDPEIKLIYPTVENVRNSLEGWAAGNSLPFNHENYLKQKYYMQKYLHKWKAMEAGRDRAMPHIKTYSRMKIIPSANNSESNAEIAWFLLTSSNLSKAAWGALQKKGKQLMIRSYELGILTFPELFQKDENTSVHLLNSIPQNLKPMSSCDTIKFSPSTSTLSKKRNRSEEEKTLIIPIRLPYDLPLTPYNFKDGDECWTWNIPRTETDCLGFRRAIKF
ncbi:tyrosyl-DNA phosphodiesterase I [Glomus cerebriforme]|uniref:Tyrosyl-DNA phosphodiesterase I n=1 Tax=Glomus cerebriforme TaxID=658196 RepID=A0A397TXR7_9GLOM|nr:tyrosyl-DNA phosphodiesterase I [Glomus cerebriforme]